MNLDWAPTLPNMEPPDGSDLTYQLPCSNFQLPNNFPLSQFIESPKLYTINTCMTTLTASYDVLFDLTKSVPDQLQFCSGATLIRSIEAYIS